MKPPTDSIICGHNLLILKQWPDACVDAVVTDPPYGLKFMGKAWDHDVPKVALWREVLRVLKPGGHLLSFFGTRTYHRGVCTIEDAGFEIRDQIGWAYGSGFPKSLDISKVIDRRAGFWRGKAGKPISSNCAMSGPNYARTDKGKPVSTAAKQWSGWGTALKPAWEPIVLARKPLEGRVIDNVLKHGTGGLSVDGCRVGTDNTECRHHTAGIWNSEAENNVHGSKCGRWPANLIHDGSPEVTELLGAARRFFYCAKASRAERNAGLDECEDAVLARSCQAIAECKRGNVVGRESGAFNKARVVKNNHPTVKPLALMRYLCRLITPPAGVVLDPFCGSGSTCIAAMQEGFHYIGIEREAAFVEIAEARLNHWRRCAE